METRFWGPSGWKLLHTIAYSYPKKPTFEQQRDYGIFFNCIKDILPCKYCRRSLYKFVKNLPLEDYLGSQNKLREWMYLIHNKVNNKLRRQGLLKKPNPPLKEIDEMYEELLKTKCNLHGWDFLYCVVFNYPKKKNTAPVEKMEAYITFFTYLGKVIPCQKYRKLYNKYTNELAIEDYLDSRRNLTHWLHLVNCKINDCLSTRNKTYKRICFNFESHRAGSCKKKGHKGKTCRLTRSDMKKRNKNLTRKKNIFKHYIS